MLIKTKLEKTKPTFDYAVKLVKAFLLCDEGAVYTKYPERLGLLPKGCKVTITPHADFCDISLTQSDGTTIEKNFNMTSRSGAFPEVNDFARIWKVSSGKVDIDSILDENIKKIVNELRNQWDTKKGFSEYYFKTYVVQFLNGETFAVVDNMLHFN